MGRKNKFNLDGISLWLPKHHSPNECWKLAINKHPLTKDYAKGTSGTTDQLEALALARKLETWLHDPTVWANTDYIQGLPLVLQAIIKPKGTSLNTLPTTPAWDGKTSGFDFHKDLDVRKIPVYIEGKRYSADDVLRIFQENDTLKSQLAVLQGKYDNAQRQINAYGISLECPKITLQDAVDAFLSDDPIKSGILKQKKDAVKHITCNVKRFALNMPGKQLDEIKPDDVIRHLATFKAGKLESQKNRKPNKDDTVRRYGECINCFLDKATQHTFKTAHVLDWMRRALKSKVQEQREGGHPLWYDIQDVDLLIKNIEGQDWKDIARVQMAGGFSPKELCYLQAQNFFIDAEGTLRITLADLVHNSKVVWSGKTENRYADGGQCLYPYDGETEKAIKRLQKSATVVLFPCALKPLQTDDFTKANRLWDTEEFVKQYNEVLRKAATAAGLPMGTGTKKLGSKTLRHSAAKVDLMHSGYSLGHTAGFLRNTEDICRKHYASLLPTDMKPAVITPALKIVKRKSKAG